MSELLQTPLHAWHCARGARMVPFAGWSMPVQYTSIVDEHRAVRTGVGVFDVSHMGRLAFQGEGVAAWLEGVTTNKVARLKPGQIQYSLLANEEGGIIDDILVYCGPDGAYSMVCNASNRERVVAHLESHRGACGAGLIDQTCELAMIAVQGPLALAALERVAKRPLGGIKYYHCERGDCLGAPALYSRTGYTGEDGAEVILPNDAAVELWEALCLGGDGVPAAAPCGLGARDTLRFEAAMPLYGHELTDEIDPFEAGIGWAVKLDKGDFLGRDALRRRKENVLRQRVGLELAGKRIAREGATVLTPGEGLMIGGVTSGTFAPTLQKSLAMALIDTRFAPLGTDLMLDIRGHREPARVCALPFYHRKPPGA